MSSKSEARRLIKGNAVKINDKIIYDEKLIVTNKLFKEKIKENCKKIKADYLNINKFWKMCRTIGKKE